MNTWTNVKTSLLYSNTNVFCQTFKTLNYFIQLMAAKGTCYANTNLFCMSNIQISLINFLIKIWMIKQHSTTTSTGGNNYMFSFILQMFFVRIISMVFTTLTCTLQRVAWWQHCTSFNPFCFIATTLALQHFVHKLTTNMFHVLFIYL